MSKGTKYDMYVGRMSVVEKNQSHQRILDAACGSKMIWFTKQKPDVLYMDNRQLTDILCDGRVLNINLGCNCRL